MQDRPTAEELLSTIAGLLEDEVLPALQGPLQHSVRVAANLCRILEREAALGPGLEQRELEQLAALLGESASRGPLALTTALDARLAPGDPELERRAWPVLVDIVRGKLGVAKPGHDAWDFRSELEPDGEGADGER